MSRLKGVGGGGGGGGGSGRTPHFWNAPLAWSVKNLSQCLNSKSMNWACMLATSLRAPFQNLHAQQWSMYSASSLVCHFVWTRPENDYY